MRPAALHAHLKFDETGGTTALDSTGNGWTGTLVNGALRTTGISGNAVDLDGTNDHVRLPTGVVNGLTNITIAAWVRLDSVVNWTRIFDFGSSTSVNMFLTPRSGITNLPAFAITTSGNGGEQRINSSVAISPNVWTHVAVTLGGGTGVLYINGVEVGRNNAMSLTPNSLGATTQNYIGKSQYADPYLNGRVDDFRIYDDALSAAEVAALAAPPQLGTFLAAAGEGSPVGGLPSSGAAVGAIHDDSGRTEDLAYDGHPALGYGRIVTVSRDTSVLASATRLRQIGSSTDATETRPFKEARLRKHSKSLRIFHVAWTCR